MTRGSKIAALVFGLMFAGTQISGAELQGGREEIPSPAEANVIYDLGPVSGNGPMVVEAEFSLNDIDAIDDEMETLEFTGVLTLRWTDRRQAFDPERAGVAEKIFQGAYQFNEMSPAWYPQVVLSNQSGLFEKHAVLLRVEPDGASTLVETINAVAKVHLEMARHPFDRQSLEAVFEVLGFDSSEVVLRAAPMQTQQEIARIRVPGWDLTGLAASTREKDSPYAGRLGRSSAYVLKMDVRRQSLFMVRLIAFPLTMIVMLSWSVFWMDRAALGDRINVSFIGILTAVAYQNVVGESLPQISFLTFTNAFINASFLVMCATVVVHLFVDRCDQLGQSERGDLIDRRCRWIFPLVYFGLLALAGAIIVIFC